jgi:hypothetical protein
MRAIEALRKAGDVWTLVDALSWTSFPPAFTGHPDVAIALATEALDIARRVGHRGGEILAERALYLAGILASNDLSAAEDGARRDLAMCEAIRSPWVSQSHAWLSFALTSRGDLEGGRHHAEEALRLEPVSAWSGLGWQTMLINRAFARDLDVCRTLLSEGLPVIGGADDPIPIGAITRLHGAAQAAAMLGDKTIARECFPALAQVADRFPLALFEPAIVHRLAAQAAATAEMWNEADHHFAEARRVVETFPNVFDVPNVDYWEARMLTDRGGAQDGDRAVSLARSARDEYERRGMPLHLQKADDLIARV